MCKTEVKQLLIGELILFMGQFNNKTNSVEFLNIISNLNELFLNEREDIAYYGYLIEIAPTIEEKEILSSIRNTKCKHALILRNLHGEISGTDVSFEANEKLVMPNSYADGIKVALSGELKEVEYYKFIRDDFSLIVNNLGFLSNLFGLSVPEYTLPLAG